MAVDLSASVPPDYMRDGLFATACLFKKLRCRPLRHIEVVLDVAVAQHEVLPISTDARL